MIIDRLEWLLGEKGYIKLESQMPEYVLFLTGNFERAELIEVIDLSKGYSITHEQVRIVAGNTKSAFIDQGYRDLHMFTLVLTDVVDTELELCASDADCWVIDLSNHRIHPNVEQAEDFYGLRGLVEKALDDTFIIRDRIQTEDMPMNSAEYHEEKKEGLLDFFKKNYTKMNTIMVTVNVIVFFVLSFLGNVNDASFMAAHGAMYAPYVLEDGEYYRLLTCMFLHFGMDHLMGNMIGLYFLGDNLERAVGKVKYLLIYFASGIIASTGSMLYYLLLRQPVVSAGASGAIFGVIGALLYIVIRNKGRLEDLTTSKIVIFIVFCIYSGITSRTVDNAAHLCGLMAGFLLSVLLYRKRAPIKTD